MITISSCLVQVGGSNDSSRRAEGTDLREHRKTHHRHHPPRAAIVSPDQNLLALKPQKRSNMIRTAAHHTVHPATTWKKTQPASAHHAVRAHSTMTTIAKVPSHRIPKGYHCHTYHTRPIKRTQHTESSSGKAAQRGKKVRKKGTFFPARR